MKTSLQTFNDQLLEKMLQFLWSAWSDLGISGYSSYKLNVVLDIEALIITTCFWGRYDQRLFDEMLSWLLANERFVNIQRLQTILKKELFQESRLIAPICSKLNIKNKTPKWRGLESKLKSQIKMNQSEKVFLFSNNKPLPITDQIDDSFSSYGFLRLPFIDREMITQFSETKVSALQLKLRAFFGIGSRSEIMLALIINKQISISETADRSYFSWKSIQEALFEMSLSGIVGHSPSKRERHYYLVSDYWHKIFLKEPVKSLKQLNFCKFFSAMEILRQKTSASAFSRLSESSANLEIADHVNNLLAPLLSAADGVCKIPSPSANIKNYFEEFSSFILTQLDQLFKS